MDRESSVVGDGHGAPSDTTNSTQGLLDSIPRTSRDTAGLAAALSGLEVMVSLRIGPDESELLHSIKKHGAYWDARRSAWRLSLRIAVMLGLEEYRD